jgi:undecaprenyl-diphosphatase
LGVFVTRSRALWPIDARARSLVGQATPVAALFTLSGRALALAAFAIAAVLAIAALHGSLVVAIAVCAAQSVSQAAAELAKRWFRRSRPDDWIFHHELGFSYPSGHAATAVLFVGSWLICVLAGSPISALTLACAALLFLWMAGIDWSRLALGAHYPVDVAGGTLYGAGWLSLLWALLLDFGAVHPK